MKHLTIGQLARDAGLNLQTVRFYERRGLLPKPPRTASGYRAFPSDSVRRLRFIKRAKELGFSLNEIKQLLALRFDPDTSCALVQQRAEDKLEDIEHKIQDLRRMKKALARLTATCPGRGSTGECPILESLES